MYGYIYKTTNLINEKIYVGQHRSSEFDNKYFGSGKLIIKAIENYGIENFKCEILEECFSEEELNEKEIYWIRELKSTNKFGNYNISDGGYVPRLSGEANGMFGKHIPKTEEQKKHLSEINKGHKPTFCRNHTEESKRKIGIKTRENNLARDKSIYEKTSKSQKGNKMMNKDGICIRVHEKDFNKYLNDGWVFGGLPRKRRKKI